MRRSIAEAEAAFRRSIPAKVFYNHFHSICYVIDSQEDKFNLRNLDFFNECRIINPDRFNLEKSRQLLFNSWSTEYALRVSALINNDEYYKFSLHWSFPQAYYSSYLSMTAFHETQSKANSIHEKSIRIFGNDVGHDKYPTCISFNATGLKDSFEFGNLPTYTTTPEGWTGISEIISIENAECQVAQFLKTTRIGNAAEKKAKYIEEKHKSFLNKSRKPLKKYTRDQWNSIYSSLHFTSLMNLLYRLRIKANYADIVTFLDADINFREFNEAICSVVNYINFVHEAYVAKCIGIDEYRNLVAQFPGHILAENANTRLNNHIAPLFDV